MKRNEETTHIIRMGTYEKGLSFILYIQIVSNPPPSQSFLIIADSFSIVHSFNPLVTRIHILLATLFSIPLSFTFIWVLSHTGIQGGCHKFSPHQTIAH